MPKMGKCESEKSKSTQIKDFLILIWLDSRNIKSTIKSRARATSFCGWFDFSWFKANHNQGWPGLIRLLICVFLIQGKSQSRLTWADSIVDLTILESRQITIRVWFGLIWSSLNQGNPNQGKAFCWFDSCPWFFLNQEKSRVEKVPPPSLIS